MIAGTTPGKTSDTLRDVYDRLYRRYGSQRWWPGDTPFEVIVGAILTQQTTWRNAHRAVTALKEAGCLSAAALRQITQADLSALIHSSGYHNAKAVKLKTFAFFLGERYRDDLHMLFGQDIETLRAELLALHGIGEETADSIILYAAAKPSFVIDAYTRRITDRLGLTPTKKTYGDYQRLFSDSFPGDTAVYNEYHALLVRLGKEACHPNPACAECCLGDICAYATGSKQS
jgi:endonuclease III related protein